MADRNTFLNLVGTAFATFAGVLGSIAVAYSTFLNVDRGHDIRMVEIGLSILRGEGDKETSLPARRFALNVIEKFSGVDINKVDADTWAKTGTTPFDSTFWHSDMSKLGRMFDPKQVCEGKPQPERTACLTQFLLSRRLIEDQLGNTAIEEVP